MTARKSARTIAEHGAGQHAAVEERAIALTLPSAFGVALDQLGSTSRRGRAVNDHAGGDMVDKLARHRCGGRLLRATNRDSDSRCDQTNPFFTSMDIAEATHAVVARGE
jgi:hypothetical protein